MQYEKLIKSIAYKFRRKDNEDLIQEAYLSLLKTKWTGHPYKVIYWGMLKFLLKETNSLPKRMSASKNSIWVEILDSLEPLEIEIIQYKFIYNYSFLEISKKIKKTKSNTFKLYKKAIKKIQQDVSN